MSKPRGPALDVTLLWIAVAIGMVGAWVGLKTSSLWIDELSTRWIVFGDGGGDSLAARLATDVHPPLYYPLLYAYARLVGTSDAALRSFSTLTACAAVVVFILGTRTSFSLPARLFASGVATGSAFWFYQSQNARDYGLSLLLATVMLSLSLSILRNNSCDQRWPRWAALALAMVLGSLNHFYLTFLAVAVLGVLFLYLPRFRLAAIAGAAVLVGLSLAYTKLIIQPHTQYSLDESWIQNDFAWNKTVIISAIKMSANKVAMLAVALCGLALIVRLVPVIRAGRIGPQATIAWLKANPTVVLCGLVPVLVICEGLASALAASPNMTDRNVLVGSPFIWGFLALIFDAAFRGERSRPLRGARLAAGALILVSASVVAGRSLPRNETYRESASWIRGLSACRGADIPVLQTDRKVWAKPAYLERTTEYAYGLYLRGYARPRMLYLEDVLSGQVPSDLKAALASRLAGAGCPVVAWSEHAINEQQVQAAGQALAKAAGFADARAFKLSLKTFPIYEFSIAWRQKTPSGYVIYVERPGEPALAH